MRTTRFFRCIFTFLGCSLIFLLVACGDTGTTPPTGGSSTSTAAPGKTPQPTSTTMPTVTTAPVPPTQTSCPPQGTVRAAITAPLALGKDANIVYLVTEFHGNTPTSTLKRFDVRSGAKTEILKTPGVTFGSPQLSADGQWVLFVTSTSQNDELQMVRMDGLGLQTLYCLPARSIQKALWSTNQQQALISASAPPNGFTGLYLINTANGTIQQVFKPTPGSNPNVGSAYVNPITWLNNTQVYVSFANAPIAPADRIGLLNTNRGVQTISDLKIVFQQTLGTLHNYPCYDADSSYDASTLYISLCGGISAPNCSGSCSLGTREGPSSINTERGIGGDANTILLSQTLGIAAIRSISSDTLLLQVENFSQNHKFDASQNGLWTVNTHGNNLTRLTTEAKGTTTSLCSFSQNPWSNVSRDSSMYAFETSTQVYPTTYTLAFGHLSGGATQTLASITGTRLEMIGWTTM